MRTISTVALCMFAAAHPTAVCAQSSDPPEPTPPPSKEPQVQASSQPGEAPLVAVGDVADRLQSAQTPHAGLLELGPVSRFDRWWDTTNNKLEDSVGLRFGLSYTVSFQAATSGPGHRSGGEGDLDLFAAWRVIGKGDEPNAGSLNFNAQNIHRIGEVAPANLASEIGAIWGTSDGIGESESFPIVQMYYEQRLFDDRAMIVLGKIDTTNYVSTNRFADDSLYFMNRAFSSNPAVNYPGNGLGAVIAGRLADEFYIGGCIADANGVETESGFESIDAGEFFSAIEAGLTLDIEGTGEGNYRLTAWHNEGASEVALPEDYGFALSIDQDMGGGVVPFFRYAWSDGDATGISNIVAGGIGLEGPFGAEEDVLGLGVSWGQPSDQTLPDQVACEAFYRVQVAPSIQCTLGTQVIFDAVDSVSGDKEVVGVFEVRLRIEF